MKAVQTKIALNLLAHEPISPYAKAYRPGGSTLKNAQPHVGMPVLLKAISDYFAKVGIQGVDSHLATALRTAVVLAFAWGMVFLTGAHSGLGEISRKSWLFLILSGLATGASWLCYYKALQMGANYGVDPFDGREVIISEYATKPIIGDLAGAMENLPNGDGIEFKLDDKTLMTSDMVRLLGRQAVASGLVGNLYFAKVSA